jgi:hypothetical protein
MRVERDGAAAGLTFSAQTRTPDLERARPDVLDLGAEDGDLADLHRMQEVDVVHRAEARRCLAQPEAASVRPGDPLHHATAVDLAWRSGMLPETPQ